MPLVGQPFATTFAFARSRTATRRDATGAVVAAAVNVARFDHTPSGVPRGLIVEGVPEQTAADRLTVATGDWERSSGTVLHAFEDEAGEIQRRAWYVHDAPRAAVDGCLSIKGRHRLIAYLPGYLRNRGGFVRWRRTFYVLGGLLSTTPDIVLGDTADQPLLEG